MKTLVINLLGGPCTRKSTFAHGLMYKLKCLGIDCEISSEYAKDIVFEEFNRMNKPVNPLDYTKLDNQVYVFGKQLHRLKRLAKKVLVVVTDAPLLHSIIYDANNRESFKNLVLEEHNSFNNLNFLLTKVSNPDYNTNGRIQTEADSNIIHDKIHKMLHDNKITHKEVMADPTNLDMMIEIIQDNLELIHNDEPGNIKFQL